MHSITLMAFVALAATALSGCAADDAAPRPGADGPAPAATPDAEAAAPIAPAEPGAGSRATRNASDAMDAKDPAQPAWTDAANAAVRPGIQTFTEGAQCTANFVFYAANGTGWDVYLGQAAHCAGTGASTETNGCTAGTLPLGTPVDLGTGNAGTLAYSSWVAMQAAGTRADAPECLGNDFALVRVAEADETSVSPQVPFFGGPTGLAATEGLGFGDEVYSYGNSGLRLGVEDGLAWKHGAVVFADAWSVDVYTATPGVPGDSGSGFLTADGHAFGVLSTVAIAPLPASNQVSGLAPALAYLQAHGGPEVRLATAPWTGGIGA